MMKILSNNDVAALLPPEQAISLVAATMQRVSAGGAEMPLRTVVPVGGNNFMGVMPGALGSQLGSQGYGVKLVSLFPGNPARGLSGHRGAMVLFEPETGGAVAMMDAGLLTAIRTAAASAVAARALARPESQNGARCMTIIGAGEQARHHAQAFATQFTLSDIRVTARTPASATACASALTAQGLPATDWGTDTAAAVQGADLIVTVTNSATPVLTGAMVAPGQHLSIVGASIPTKREIDDTLLTRADVWVDYLPSALAQAGEIVDGIAGGVITANHLRGEIGAVLAGTLPGRQHPDQITAYRSLGVIAQDLACAAHVLSRARAEGYGQDVDFG